jgi:hypothetical protein
MRIIIQINITVFRVTVFVKGYFNAIGTEVTSKANAKLLITT